ncbi:Protein VAC14 [Glycine max]|nr:Protein VAC14 [Glycine max]
MADALSVIPAAVLRNLADKLYEKRKNAALEVEGIVKQLAGAGDHDRITAVITLLTTEFTYSPQANHRKGGLISLAAATVGLTTEAAQHLEQIVPPVLNSFADQDSRVRYYACEALYNIAKVVRGDFIIFFNQIFDALCKLSADSDANVQSAAHLLDRLVKDIVTESDQFSIEEFIPLLRERMNVLNPYVRQFLVGWITVLDSVPDIDMLGFLPDFLDGLFNMLSDSSHEIRQQADSALSEFLQEIKNSPINEFVKLGGDQLVPYYADILGAVLPCISDKEEKIRVVARETNEELRAIKADPAEAFDVGAILSIARRQLSSEWEATRIEALHWISTLLSRHRSEVLTFLNDIFETLLKALSDSSDEVVLLVLDVHACIARDPHHFRQLVVFLVHNFRLDNSLLEKRGALIVRRLCVLLNAERVYRELSTILERESDFDFASIMVQALNLILLTSSELSEIRDLLKQSLQVPTCHIPRADIVNNLLEPGRYIWLFKALYGLLMLLPQQSAAFKILKTRLKAVPLYSFNGEQLKRMPSGDSYQFRNVPDGFRTIEDGDVAKDGGSSRNGINFAARLQQFQQMQHQHRVLTKTQAKLRNMSTSLSKHYMQEPQREEEPRKPQSIEVNVPPSRSSSKRGPGQLQL